MSKRSKPEEIVGKLGEIDVHLAHGEMAVQADRLYSF